MNLALKQEKINEDTKKLKDKKVVCIYKTNFMTAAFNRSMKNTFLSKSERVK